VRRGDCSAFWHHYHEALRRSKHEGRVQVASQGTISFEMIEPAT
jgi:hypothetical protein